MTMMKTYLFDLGDSSTGPVGAVIEVQAESKRQALRLARKVAEKATDHPVIVQTEHGQARFYLNPEKVLASDGWREV